MENQPSQDALRKEGSEHVNNVQEGEMQREYWAKKVTQKATFPGAT